MDLNFLSWWHKKRVQAEVKYSGRPVQAHRVTNPYHAVSIKAGPSCRKTAETLGGKRFLSFEAPPLPQPTCSPQGCSCRYLHHADRRSNEDRRERDVWNPTTGGAEGRDRRRSRGRRVTDH